MEVLFFFFLTRKCIISRIRDTYTYLSQVDEWISKASRWGARGQHPGRDNAVWVIWRDGYLFFLFPLPCFSTKWDRENTDSNTQTKLKMYVCFFSFVSFVWWAVCTKANRQQDARAPYPRLVRPGQCFHWYRSTSTYNISMWLHVREAWATNALDIE